MKTYTLFGLVGLSILILTGGLLFWGKEPAVTPADTPIATSTADTPSPSTPITTNTPTFNQPAELSVGQIYIFADGLSVTLKSIDDSRCKPGVQCVWAGELAPVLLITGGEFGTNIKEIRLGTSLNDSESSRGYIFALITATTKTATLKVSKAITQSTGEVTGQVKIGPICPVETVDEPCVIPVETYTSRNVVVFSGDGSREITRSPLDATGKYSLPLVPGTYQLQIQPAGIGAGEMKLITIVANQTVTMDFDIDTGIR